MLWCGFVFRIPLGGFRICVSSSFRPRGGLQVRILWVRILWVPRGHRSMRKPINDESSAFRFPACCGAIFLGSPGPPVPRSPGPPVPRSPGQGRRTARCMAPLPLFVRCFTAYFARKISHFLRLVLHVKNSSLLARSNPCGPGLD